MNTKIKFEQFEKYELFDNSKIFGGDSCDTSVYNGGVYSHADKNVDDSTTYQGNSDDDVENCE